MDPQKINFKIVLFGEKGIGRETLLKGFSVYQDEGYIDIIGAEFSSKTLTIEADTVSLLIWNVNYEEEFRFKLPSFIKSSRAALLMYDITNIVSFNYLSDLPQVIRRYTGDIPILIVGNKLDLEQIREVSEGQVENFKEAYNIFSSMEISAKTGENVEEMFMKIVKIIRMSGAGIDKLR